MWKLVMKRLQPPATVVAALALFVALGGGAAAYASGLVRALGNAGVPV